MGSVPFPTVELIFRYQDCDRNKGQMRLHLPFATTVDDAFDFAFYAADRIAGITDAALVRIQLNYKVSIEDQPPPDNSSDIQRLVMLFGQNTAGVHMVNIPSPRAEIFETTGPYTGIRVNNNHPAVTQFALLMSDAFYTVTGDPFGIYLVGGLAL